MSERKIVVPEGMFARAHNAHCARTGTLSDGGITQVILEAALRWLSENPIVPSEKQTDALASHFSSSDELFGTFARWFAVEWQRRMFLAPEHEVPEEIKDLLQKFPGFGAAQDARDSIIEAHRRGRFHHLSKFTIYPT